MKFLYDLKIEQQQSLVMTPELLQAIKILQLSTRELHDYAHEQLLSNPVLEQDFSRERKIEHEKVLKYMQEYGREGLRKGYSSGNLAGEVGYNDIENNKEDEITLKEHLLFQFHFLSADENEKKTGRFLIETLDDSGYMTMTEKEIAEAVGVEKHKVEDVVAKVRSLDPPGIAAKNLANCLELQLEALGELDRNFSTLINDHLQDIAENKLSKIARKMKLTVKEVQSMVDRLKKLDPKPGNMFNSPGHIAYVSPDIFVFTDEDTVNVMVNEGAGPSLKIGAYYESLLKSKSNDKKLKKFLSERMDSAIWLIRSIEQRKQTIKAVAESIVKKQKKFFRSSENHMKIMTLKEVAEDVGVHESTVSRAINGKYLQCESGIFELKYFFSQGIKSDGNQGEGISSNSIKEYLKQIISSEDSKSPYSDQKIAEMLKEKGINISRRTVAKYRDEEGILSSSGRRRY